MAYRTRPELGLELLERLCNSCPERHFHAYADTTFVKLQALKALKDML